MLPRVDFVMTCLSEWHNQASAQTAAGEDRHDAEVEEHSAASVHLFGAANTCVAQLGARAVFFFWLGLGLS